MTDDKISVFQKWIIILIAIITVINFIDRSAISFVHQHLEAEFGITKVQFGLIASAFGIGYVITTLFGGVMVDRFGTIGTWAISAALWSIATMLLAFGTSYRSFFWIRVFLGLAEGIHFPALVRTVTDWIPVRWRARASALGLFGIPFASILGAPLITFLITKFSWRTMFVFLGALGVVWAFFWLLLFRKHPHALFATVKEGSPEKTGIVRKIPWKAILLNPTFFSSCSIYFAYGYTLFFVLMWAPSYLVNVHKISLQETGLYLVPPWICAAIFMIGGGWLSDYLWKKTQSLRIARSYLIGFGLLLSGSCFIPLIFSQGLVWDLMWLSLGLGFASILHPPIYTLNADLFGPFAGIAQGITSAYFAISGILSPSLTGWFTQVTGNFHAAILLVVSLSLVTSTVVILFQRPDRERRMA
jgi:MFS family permease